MSPTELRDYHAAQVFGEIRDTAKGLQGAVLRLFEIIAAKLFEQNLNVNTAKLDADLRGHSATKAFHHTLGLTPKAFITSQRVRVAKILLRETRLKIWQICDLLGFSQLGVFSKSFERSTGVRPSLYRAQSQPAFLEELAARYSQDFLASVLQGRAHPEEAREVICIVMSLYPRAAANRTRPADQPTATVPPPRPVQPDVNPETCDQTAMQ